MKTGSTVSIISMEEFTEKSNIFHTFNSPTVFLNYLVSYEDIFDKKCIFVKVYKHGDFKVKLNISGATEYFDVFPWMVKLDLEHVLDQLLEEQ